MSSSVNFLYFAIRTENDKNINSHLCSVKTENRLQMGVSSLLYLLERGCNTLDNTARKLNDNDLFHYIIILLGHVIIPLFLIILIFSINGNN